MDTRSKIRFKISRNISDEMLICYYIRSDVCSSLKIVASHWSATRCEMVGISIFIEILYDVIVWNFFCTFGPIFNRGNTDSYE